jgi:hypothetical protein
VGRPGLGVALAASVWLSAAAAFAHWLQPDDVLAELRSPALARSFDVQSVERNANLPRLLVMHVGPRWEAVDPALRQQSAERWFHLWRSASRLGILAIVDASGRSLVSFDAFGHAQLRSHAPATKSGSP